MDESEDYLSSECWTKVDINSAVKVKPKKRSLVERELETNLTARITSPVTFGDGTSTSRYGRARRLKTETDSSDSRKITLEVLKSTPPEKSPSKLQSPVYKMHASNSPIRTISPKRVPDEMFLENQIETIYQENISLSRFSTDEITKSSPCKSKKIYIRKDLIQNREPEEEVVLIKSIFSPVKDSDKSTNTHLNNILERSSEKFRLITKDNTQNGFIGNSSVVKTLDFDNKKKKKENKDTKCISKSDLFELEARCLYQVGDLAWSRMGTYPFWPCIVTRDPTTGIYVKKKLFGRIERDVIHVTFFGDNGRRGWIVDSMLRKFKGLAEFESTRDKFTAEDKKKDPKLYAAYFISDKKQPLWNISVEEAETLLREPKRLRIELLNDILENSKSYKTNNKTHKSGKVTRTDSDVSLSESLYDTLFSEDDGKTDDSERSKNKSRNKSLDVSEVVTACLDNMAAKTGITKIQRQSHMDRWLQKAKSKTPEKSHIKAQIPKIVVDNKVFNNKKKKPHREPKPYNLRKSLNESHNLLAYHNEHDYSKFVSDDDSSSVKTNISDGFIENKYEFVPLEESGSGIGVITKIESLADHKDQSNIFRTINNDDFIVTSNKDAKEVCENADISLTEKETQNVESHQSQKFILVQDKDAGINYDNSDDQQVSECTILKENKNPPCDVNSSEIDSTLKVTENSEISNENPMEIDSTDVCKIISSNTILENNNLSVNENISIVNSEMTTDNGNHDISKNNLNSHAEKSNVIPVNHVNFKKEEVNDSVVASVRIEQETTANKGDNIILDLKLLQKNKCDDVNINNEDCFLFQTESAFIHSIKSTYEDNLEDKNSIYNLAKEINISDTKILSKTNFINNGNIGNSKKINENKIIHLNFLCNNSHTEETVDHIKSSQEFYDNLTSQKEDTEGKGSIVQEMHDNRNLELNKSSSINLDNCQNSYRIVTSNNELVDADHTPNVLIMDTKIQIISKELRKELRIEDSIKDIIVEDKIKKYAQKSYNINSLHGTIMRKNEIVDSKETFISNLIESDVEITGEEDNLKGTVYKEKNGIYPEELFNINKSQETETRKNSIVDSIEKMDVNLSVSDIETTLKEKSLNDTVNEEIIEKHQENYLNISILQETETRKNGIVDSIETLDVNLSVSDIETFKGNSRKDHLDEEIIEKNPEDFRSISKIQETETRKNAIMGSNETLDVNLTESDMETTSIESSLKDTVDKEKIETNPKVSYNINRLQETERRNKIVDPNETLDVNLTKSEIKISLKEDNLYNLQDKVSKKNIDKDAVESLTNVFQECETNKFVGNDNDVENTHMNSDVSGILSNKEKSRINECNNPEFLKYLELRQDAVMDEYPELNEDAIVTYLYQTWLYEESRKSEIKKANNLEQANSVKGLDHITHKKRSRRLKASHIETKKQKSTAERNDKNSASESVTSQVVFFKKNLSLKRDKKMITLSVGDLSNVPETKKDNTTVYSTDKNEINKKNHYNKEIEIATSFKCDSIIPNIDKKESEIICNSVASIDKDPQLLSLHSGPIAMVSTTFTDNCCEKINNIKENVCDETASIDSEISDVPLIYRKLRIKTREDLSNEKEKSKVVSKEEIKSNESFNSVDSESSITKCNEKSKQDMKKMNTTHEDPDASKEESVINNDSFNSTDSETSSSESKHNGKQDRESINTLDVNLEANIVDYETNNDTINVITSEECLVKSKQKSKHNVKTLNLSLETNVDDSDSNVSSVNVFNVDTTLTRPKVKSKFHRNTVNPLDDVEFQKYLELRRDTLLDENPQLTQEEIINYLYKTWLYEENSKSDLKKTDVIAQSGLVKGLEQEIVPPKRIKKKVKVPKEITDYFDVSPKEKPKRKTIKPLYNEDYYDLEDDIECFEVNKNDDCGSPIAINVEQTQQGNDKSIDDNHDAYHLQEEVKDSAEIYFSELIKPKPNIFKGLLREKVCEICEKTGNLVKCKTCHGMFHVNCVLDDKVVEISTPMRGRKKKRKGRKAKNQEESEVHSDDKQDISEENNISMEEIEMESLTVDAVTLETQLHEKMKELIESSEAINYDSYTSDNELDWNDTIAGKCEIVDVKLKRKSCEGYVDYTDYKCNNCLKYDTPVCFVCKSDISKKESKVRQRCNVAHCNKYYHLECLDHWPQTQFNAGEPSKYNKKINEYFESVSCPRHVCHTCVSDDPRGCKTRFSGDKLARCVRCPATYHSFTKCIPAGSQILTASHIICPRHYQHRPGKVPCHVNTGWCFICALGGSLICCEYCPTSFHAECLNIDPPEGGYMCEDCETGRLPLYGEMVWVKLGHYRWWPGLILHPSEIPNNIMAVKHSRGEFVVRFFGQYDYYWVNRGRVFPFQEGDTGRISSQRSKIDAAFTTAIEHAHRACEVLKSAIPNEEESMDIASSLLPPHYVKLKVNKPCGSLCGRKLDDPELSLTQCDCNPDVEDPCGPYSQCLNRMLLTECGPSCRAGDRCNNRAFEKRLYPKLVPYRTPQRGWGLKTLEDIKAGQFVIEYVGELIDEGEFKRRMRRKHEIRDENFYFLTLDKERMIDAGPKGNLARFMNHCCEPNCETQKWTVLGDVRVGLFALYDIPANSEVTFNYNLESAGIEKKRCMCGAKRCSGYIGAKPKQDEPQSKKGKVKRTYKKRNLEESPSSATVKTKPKRLGRPPKPKDLTDIERDLLIIRNATGALSSDESSRSFSSDGERLSRPLKRKRVDFSTEDAVALDPPESPNTKRQKFNEKEVGD